MGRYTHPNGLPSDLLEIVLQSCGRTILVAGADPPQTLIGTIVVCRKDSRESAHAVSVAMPLLAKASRVIIHNIDEGGPSAIEPVNAGAEEIRWHCVRAEAEVRTGEGRPVAEMLRSAGRTYGADLLVMGGYSKGRMREKVFGGCTDSMLKRADIPVLMVH